MAEGQQAPGRPIRLAAVVLSAVFLFLAFANLILVSEAQPDVEPTARAGPQWTVTEDSPETEGTHTWAFTIDPQGRRVVELEVAMPYTTRVTHVAGTASLTHHVRFTVDEDVVAEARDVIEVEPKGNKSERVSRTTTHNGDLGTEADVLRITRSESGPFAILVTWQWHMEAEEGTEVDFRTAIRPVTVQSLDTPGLPGCGSTCARVLLVLAVVAQAATFGWYRALGRNGTPEDQAGQKAQR